MKTVTKEISPKPSDVIKANSEYAEQSGSTELVTARLAYQALFTELNKGRPSTEQLNVLDREEFNEEFEDWLGSNPRVLERNDGDFSSNSDMRLIALPNVMITPEDLRRVAETFQTDNEVVDIYSSSGAALDTRSNV